MTLRDVAGRRGRRAPLRQISSFGVGGDGSIYAVSLAGDVFRLEPAAHAGDLGDRLRGGPGDDRIYGGPGDDRLHGDGSDDRLQGGFGAALRFAAAAGATGSTAHAGSGTLVGGGDADRFVFDARPGGGEVDDVLDFACEIDRSCWRAPRSTDLGAALSRREFREGDGGDDAARIVYSRADGTLAYAADGEDTATEFARVGRELDLRAQDCLLV